MKLAKRLGSPAQITRFVIVGLSSTLAFLLCQCALIGGLHLNILTGTTISIGISLLLSYLGHHRVTFKRSGAHGRYGTRFVIATAVMITLSNALAYGFTTLAGRNFMIGSLVVSFVYPVGSFLLQTLWVFRAQAPSSELV